MTNPLRTLYDTSAEHMTYGIGTMDLGVGPPAPIIMIQHGDWSREKLKMIRESFKGGIILTCSEHKPGVHHIHLATREVLTFEHAESEHTSVLRAPAWDAHLADVDHAAFRVFEAHCRQRGGFLLLVQAHTWEFLTVVDDGRGTVSVGVLLARATSTSDGRSRPEDSAIAVLRSKSVPVQFRFAYVSSPGQGANAP
jgi:hypothetical protein